MADVCNRLAGFSVDSRSNDRLRICGRCSDFSGDRRGDLPPSFINASDEERCLRVDVNKRDTDNILAAATPTPAAFVVFVVIALLPLLPVLMFSFDESTAVGTMISSTETSVGAEIIGTAVVIVLSTAVEDDDEDDDDEDDAADDEDDEDAIDNDGDSSDNDWSSIFHCSITNDARRRR